MQFLEQALQLGHPVLLTDLSAHLLQEEGGGSDTGAPAS